MTLLQLPTPTTVKPDQSIDIQWAVLQYTRPKTGKAGHVFETWLVLLLYTRPRGNQVSPKRVVGGVFKVLVSYNIPQPVVLDQQLRPPSLVLELDACAFVLLVLVLCLVLCLVLFLCLHFWLLLVLCLLLAL